MTLLATTREVPRRVVERIGYSGNAATLASQVQVTFDFSTGALRFSTTQDTAERAETIADAFADETNAYLAERQPTPRLSKRGAHRPGLAGRATGRPRRGGDHGLAHRAVPCAGMLKPS